MTIILGILGFHNCDGCSRKVRSALREIGVEMVNLDRENGNVTVSSAENPEVIRYALERKLKKSVVVLSRDLVPANQNTRSVVTRQASVNPTIDLQGLGQVALRLAPFGGVEITNTDMIGTNFISRETKLVFKPETRHHHSRHHGQPQNRETQVVVRQKPRDNNIHPQSNHQPHHHHHRQQQNQETQVVVRQEPRGNTDVHPQKHCHDHHHGQSQNRRHH